MTDPSKIGIDNPDEETTVQPPRQEAPPEELLDFLEGNPGGRPCRDPAVCPEPDAEARETPL